MDYTYSLQRRRTELSLCVKAMALILIPVMALTSIESLGEQTVWVAENAMAQMIGMPLTWIIAFASQEPLLPKTLNIPIVAGNMNMPVLASGYAGILAQAELHL